LSRYLAWRIGASKPGDVHERGMVKGVSRSFLDLKVAV